MSACGAISAVEPSDLELRLANGAVAGRYVDLRFRHLDPTIYNIELDKINVCIDFHDKPLDSF